MKAEQESVVQTRTIVVSVNGHQVSVPHKISGEGLKQAAIDQGVPIELDFVLFRKHGHDYEQIADDETIEAHKGEEFRCVAPDDVA